MANTDERIRNRQRVTPAFLFAALLWAPVNRRAQALKDDGLPYSVAIQKAATAVIGQQVRHVSIPRRFTTTMRDIWGLQGRFHYRRGKRANAVLAHPKFRAGYDFLCLRAQAAEAAGNTQDGNGLMEDCQWWTGFQQGKLPDDARARRGGAAPASGQQSGQQSRQGDSVTAAAEPGAAQATGQATGQGGRRRRRRRPRRRKSRAGASDAAPAGAKGEAGE